MRCVHLLLRQLLLFDYLNGRGCRTLRRFGNGRSLHIFYFLLVIFEL